MACTHLPGEVEEVDVEVYIPHQLHLLYVATVVLQLETHLLLSQDACKLLACGSVSVVGWVFVAFCYLVDIWSVVDFCKFFGLFLWLWYGVKCCESGVVVVVQSGGVAALWG